MRAVLALVVLVGCDALSTYRLYEFGDDCPAGSELPSAIRFYVDKDADGFGWHANSIAHCFPPEGFVDNGQDCDDDAATTYPGATELCDEADNNCNGAVDDNAVGTNTFYRDTDGDGYGITGESILECNPPDGYVADSGDCAPTDAAIHPGATELCDEVDNDCDGAIDEDDAADALTWYLDSDDDGYGSTSTTTACELPAGYTDNADDCDDTDRRTHPGATELCDGTDRDCDGDSEEGGTGAIESCAALSCKAIIDEIPDSTDGVYWLDPDEDGDAFEAFCDMTADGGGWTLLSWSGNTNLTPRGLPYPGLAPCPTADCVRGSAADVDQLEALIRMSTELGKSQDTTAKSSFAAMDEYDYAGSYDYGDLSTFDLQLTTGTCSTTGGYTGTFTALVGPATYSGTTVYMAQAMRYSSYNYASDSGSYIWNIGVPTSLCSGNGSMPGTWMGTWTGSQYGPYLTGAGAHAVWVR